MIKSIKLSAFLLCVNAVSVAQSDSTSYFEINQLKEQLTKTVDDTTRSLILGDLSYTYAYSHFDSSMLYAQQASTLAGKIDFDRGTANALCGLGNLYLRQGDYPRALQYQLQALQLSEQYHFEREKAISLLELGYTYQNLSDYSRSLDFLNRAKEIFSKIPSDNFKKVENAIGISNVYMATGKKDSALANMQQVFDDSQNLEMFHVILQAMGDILSVMQNYTVAKNYLHQAITLDIQRKDPYSLIWAYYSIARLYQDTKEIDSCIYYAKKGFSISQEINLNEGILTHSLILSQALEASNAAEALYFLKIYDEVNNKMYGQGKILELQKTLAEEQERQRHIEEKRTVYENRIRLYAFTGGLAIMILIAFFLYRNNRQKQKANTVLQRTLTDLKSTQAQLIQSEKMASLGELTAGIAHEIQNPLNFVNNFSEVNKELIVEMREEIAKGNYDEVNALAKDVEDNQERIGHHGKRADSIVKGMLQHSRSSTGTREPTDINALADEYLRLAYHGLRAKDKLMNATLQTDFGTNIGQIDVIPQDIGRVLLNLYNNAFYAVTEKKNEKKEGYEPTLWVVTSKANGRVFITVKDNGNGIPQKVLDKIFQPFFTTKPTGQGTGLGLSLAYDTVKAHGGELRVETKEGEGSEFIVELPSG